MQYTDKIIYLCYIVSRLTMVALVLLCMHLFVASSSISAFTFAIAFAEPVSSLSSFPVLFPFHEDMSKELFWRLGLHGDKLNVRSIETQNNSIFRPGPSDKLDSLSSAEPPDNTIPARCFSLRESRYCGGSSYGKYRMSALVAVDGQHVSSAAAFDRALDRYFGTQDEFHYINGFFSCHSWTGHPKPRFRILYTCRSLLESAEARACNKDKRPPPLCVDACSGYVDGWSTLTTNTNMCANVTASEERRLSLQKSCEAWPYNGQPRSCVPSLDSSVEVCGFPTGHLFSKSNTDEHIEIVCNFCRNSSDHCCKNLSTRIRCTQKRSSRVAYLALVISTCILTVAIFGFVAWAVYRKRRAAGTVAKTRSVAEKHSRDAAASIYWIHRRSLSAIGCPHNSFETIPARVHSSAIDKVLNGLEDKLLVLPASEQTSIAVNKSRLKTGLMSRTAMAFTRILAFTANVKRKVAPSFMAPESCQTTPSLKNDSSNNAGILANRRSLKTGFKDDSCVEGTSADPMDVSSIINIYSADKKNKSSIIRSAKEASAENKESIGPRLSRRNQSLRGCPEQLACQENLAGTLTKSETNSLDKSSNRSSIQIDANLISSCTFAVLYPYLPVESDELRIEPGDQVRLLHLFSDGWIFVQKANDGSIGAVPAVCLDTDPSVFVDYGKEEQEADCTDGTNAY